MRKIILFCLLCCILIACSSGASPKMLSQTPSPETAGPPAKPTLPPVSSTFNAQQGIQDALRVLLSQGNDSYALLQFTGPLDASTRSLLEKAGVILYDNIPNYAYYAFLPGKSLPVLEKLLQGGKLSAVNAIPNEAKLQPQMAEKVRAEPRGRFEVVVQFFHELTPTEKIQVEGLVQVSGYSFGPVNFAEGSILASDLPQLLALPFVKWVEERIPADIGG